MDNNTETELVIPHVLLAHFMFNSESGPSCELEGWLCGEVVQKKYSKSSVSGDLAEKVVKSYVISEIFYSTPEKRMNETLPEEGPFIGWFSIRRGSQPHPSLLERAHLLVLPQNPPPILLLLCCDTILPSPTKYSSLLAFLYTGATFSPMDIVIDNLGIGGGETSYLNHSCSLLPVTGPRSSLRSETDSIFEAIQSSASVVMESLLSQKVPQ